MKLPEPKYENTIVEIANIQAPPNPRLTSGHLIIGVDLDYGGGGQACGHLIDVNYIKSFMGVFGAQYLNDCCGPVIVEHDDDTIKRLLPINPAMGKEFDITTWSNNLKNQRSE